MRYDNLQQLIRGSSSTRRYFLSLPVETQLTLHAHGAWIHTADELHRCVSRLAAYRRQLELSGHKGRML